MAYPLIGDCDTEKKNGYFLRRQSIVDEKDAATSTFPCSLDHTLTFVAVDAKTLLFSPFSNVDRLFQGFAGAVSIP